jgi:DNA-binding transcriptional MerR regulator
MRRPTSDELRAAVGRTIISAITEGRVAERVNCVRIGRAAEQSGVGIDAIRYYERLGLLSAAPRTPGGFRLYSPVQIEQLRAIRRAQALGLALREIRELVNPDVSPGREHCRAVRQILGRRLQDIDARVEELQRLRRRLAQASERCDQTLRRADAQACPIVDELGARSSA